MIRRLGCALLLPALFSCGSEPVAVTLPVETEFFLLNLSRRWYATIGLRPTDETGDFTQSKLIPPGAVFRERFLVLFPDTGGCPDRLDLRVHLFKRIHEDLPIGLDPEEQVEPQAISSAEITDVEACEVVVLSTYTIVLLDSPEGTGVIRFAQESGGEQQRSFSGRNLPDLANVPLRLLDDAPLSGRVLFEDGSPAPDLGVLLRARFRVNVDDSELCPDEPVGLCFSEPIAFDITNEEGRFSFDRPPGAYMVEVFGDGLLFRPGFVVIESPIDNILFVAEPES